MTTLKKIANLEEFYTSIEKDQLSVVYFYTNWCPDCFVLKPYLPKIENDFPQVVFYKMNRNDDLELTKHLNIYGIPSFLVYKNGEELGRLVNKKRKSYEEIKTFIETTIG